MSTECDICTEVFNKRAHKRIECVECHADCCSTCFGTYLLGNPTINPQCMFCKKNIHMDFIKSVMTKKFFDELSNARHEIVFSRHKSLLPETQQLIDERKQLVERHKLGSEMIIKVKEKKKELAVLRFRLKNTTKEFKDIKNQLADQIDIKKGEIYLAQERIKELNQNNIVIEKTAILRKCPDNECRGFLSTAWKCGICERHFCSDCHDHKEEEHVCDEDTKATMKLLKDTTKPCPKCGVQVIKVDGCDQVFCVVPTCRTPFSWRTGEIDKSGNIHSPDYYRFVRDRNNGEMPRNPEDNVCGANRLPDFIYMKNRFPGVNRSWHQYFRLAAHIEYTYRTHNFPATIDDFDGSVYRVKYLTGEINEVQWKKSLKAAIKKNEKKYEIGQVFKLFHDVIVDYFRILLEDLNMGSFKEKALYIRNYCIQSLNDINKKYKSKDTQYVNEMQRDILY